MYLKLKGSDDLIDVCEVDVLANPLVPSIVGRSQAGEEEQPPLEYLKTDLVFPSSEPLPACWTDPEYKQRRP